MLLGGGDSRRRRPRLYLTITFLALMLTSSSHWFPVSRLNNLESPSLVTSPPFWTKMRLSTFSGEGSSQRLRPSRNLLPGYGFWLQPSRINRGKIHFNFTFISISTVYRVINQPCASYVLHRSTFYNTEATEKHRSVLEVSLLPSVKLRSVASFGILRQLKTVELQPPVHHQTYLKRIVARNQQLLFCRLPWIHLSSNTLAVHHRIISREAISPKEGPHCLCFSGCRDRYDLLHQCSVELSHSLGIRVLRLKLLGIDGVPDFVVLFALFPGGNHRCIFPISYRQFNRLKAARVTGFVTNSRHTGKFSSWMNSLFYRTLKEHDIRLSNCCSDVPSTVVSSFLKFSSSVRWRRNVPKGGALMLFVGHRSIISKIQNSLVFLSILFNRLYESPVVLAIELSKCVTYNPLRRMWVQYVRL